MKKYFGLVLVCLLVLAGCGTSGGAGAGADDSSAAYAVCEPQTEDVMYDFTTLYLHVLEDLWSEDHGLNSGAFYISLDLSDAPGSLTPEEIAYIAETFAEAHQAQPLTLTYQELKAQGYLSNDGEHWDDGVLFSIEQQDLTGETLPEGHFSVSKWRASEGGYFFTDCVAHWSADGSFKDYEVLSEAIS